MVAIARRFAPFVVAFCLLITAPAEARELKIIFSSYTPPYVFQDGVNEPHQSGTGEKPGILVELVQQAFAGTDYTVKPVFLPLGRGFKLLEEGKVDGISISTLELALDAHYSDFSIEYHNFAIGLEERGLQVKSVEDLKGKSVIAFQKADTYLGDAFAAAVKENPDYIEMANQENQVHMLLLGRTDLAVMDRSIFMYYRNKLIKEGKLSPDSNYRLYDLFEPSRYRAAFYDESVRDAFNSGLRRLRESGEYEAIYKKYIYDFYVYRD